MQVWQTDDGLPNDAVTSAVQTQDGYMWIGTFDGLARFDGQRFQVFNPVNTPALDDLRVISLFEDPRGVLWIGHETGAITLYRGGHFESPAPATAPISDAVAIGSDETGQIWVLRGSGAADAIETGKRARSLVGPGVPQTMLWSRNARGEIWVVENGQAARLLNGAWVRLRPDHAGASEYVIAATASADGGVWLFRDGHIRKYIDNRLIEDRGNILPDMQYISCSLELSDGTLAIGTVEAGLYLVFRGGKTVHLDRASGLPQNWVRFLFQDREGNVWFGSGSSGLVSIHPTAFSKLTAPDQWGGRTVLSVAAGRHGGLWVGTEGAGLYHFRRGNWKQYTGDDGLVNPFVWAVTEDKDSRVWAGNWIGGPYRLENDRFVRIEGMDTASGPLTALYPDDDHGALLIGSRDGAIEYKGASSRWLFKGRGAGPANVSSILRDKHGTIWIGLAHDGLIRAQDDKLTTFTKIDGLPSNSVECLYSENDALWVGTSDGGLACFKNQHFVTISVAQGLADNAIYHIADDGLGFLWLTTQRGIQRIAKAALDKCVDQRISAVSGQLYDRDDGLPTAEYSAGLQAAGCKSDDGRLWFASSKGLFAVDPARIQTNTLVPPVVLDSVRVDGKIVQSHASAVTKELPPDHERLEFRFTALSFTAPGKVHFKYRLEGIDKDWIETRSRSAEYSRLSPGFYRFRVIGCNNDDVWNKTGASLAFVVAPFFWQTWWFEALTAFAIVLAVFWVARFITRRRLQRRMEELERQNAIALERGRIARDIHDDLGGSLTKIVMISQGDREELRETPQAAAILNGIYTTAREGIRALDQIVWAVNPEHDSFDSLVSYMQKYADDYLGAANIRCRQEVPIDVPAWPLRAEARHNLFLAFKEVLNNTVKHSGATEVSIKLSIEPDVFVLHLKDNGRGFNPLENHPSSSGRVATGNGLLNLDRRLKGIGGRCEMNTVKGQGTEVIFTVLISEYAIGPGLSSKSAKPEKSAPEK